MPAKYQNPTCDHCDKPPIAKNLCWTHYGRKRRTGSVDAPRRLTLEDVLARYEVDETTGCWRWTGVRNPVSGYGQGSLNGASFYAHRLFYEHHVGPIPEGFTVDHECRNAEWVIELGRPEGFKDCVNPEHLRARSSGDNTRRSLHLYRRRKHPPEGA